MEEEKLGEEADLAVLSAASAAAAAASIPQKFNSKMTIMGVDAGTSTSSRGRVTGGRKAFGSSPIPPAKGIATFRHPEAEEQENQQQKQHHVSHLQNPSNTAPQE